MLTPADIYQRPDGVLFFSDWATPFDRGYELRQVETGEWHTPDGERIQSWAFLHPTEDAYFLGVVCRVPIKEGLITCHERRGTA